jgi:hypothetical protein
MLCIAFAMVALLDVLCNALMASGGLVLSAGILAGLAPVLHVLNVAWIPRAGAFGAPVLWRTVLRVGAAGIVIGAISMLVLAAELWLLIKLGVPGVLYLALLWVNGEITIQDVRPFALWKAERN